MSLLNVAASLFMEKLGGGEQLDKSSVINALQSLLPTEGGELNIGGLVSQFMSNGGLSSMVSSWLGDGGNLGISASQVMNVLGEGRIAEFAQQLGLNTETAAAGLSDMIPDLIDKNSRGGDIDLNAGLDMAKGILGKFF